MDDLVKAKKKAAEFAVKHIKNGMTIGLGTGSTAFWAIQKIGERIQKENLQIRAIATSTQSEELARERNIPIVPFSEIDMIDLTIDGADEVDDQFNLIKGGGGALLREKIVATNSKQLIIVVDETKQVDYLGKFPLPVELTIFGWEKTIKKLQSLNCIPRLRTINDQPYLTDNNNYIVDCDFQKILQPAVLNQQINRITGVVDNGLFIQLADLVIVGFKNGKIKSKGQVSHLKKSE